MAELTQEEQELDGGLVCAQCGRCCHKWNLAVPEDNPLYLTLVKLFNIGYANVPIDHINRVEITINATCKAFDTDSRLCKLQGKKRAKICDEYHCWEEAAFLEYGLRLEQFLTANARRMSRDMNDQAEVNENKQRILALLLKKQQAAREKAQEEEQCQSNSEVKA